MSGGGGTRLADLATALLRRLGATVRVEGPTAGAVPLAGGDPDLDALATWAACGGAWLTGYPDGPPLGGPASIAVGFAAVAAALRTVADWAGVPLEVDGPTTIGQRAASVGLGRAGRVSAGGACRLVPAADGWIAVNLPRDEDHALLPAWLGVEPGDLAGLVRATADRPATDVVAQGQLLGLPVAAVPTARAAMTDEQAATRGQTWPASPWLIDGCVPRPDRDAGAGPRRSRRPARDRPPLVADLSSLWAGPLATRLLADAGARVVKVESGGRPDGLRGGDPALFDRLNAGKASVLLDLTEPAGIDRLRQLLLAADIVVEASRPRALDQLGCGPGDLLGQQREQVWVSITGYGRTGPWHQHAALGDDAAIAGGLAVWTGDGPVFCADAVADPATGLHAALAALACWYGGGTHHVDLALREVAASLVPDLPDGVPGEPAAQRDAGGWQLAGHAVRRPQAGRDRGAAAPPGADTARILADLDAGRLA